MIRAADLLAEGRRIPGMAGTSTVHGRTGPRGQRGSATRPPTTGTTRSRSTGSRARAAGSYEATARLTGPHEVTVGDQVFRARRAIVLDTGTGPSYRRSRVWPAPRTGPITRPSRATEVPDSLVILGGGADRRRAGPGVRPVRRQGHRRRGRGPADPAGGAGEQRAAGQGVRRRGHRRRTGRQGDAVSYERQPLHRDRSTAASTVVGGPAAGRHRPQDRPGPALGVGVLGIDDEPRALPVDDRLQVAPTGCGRSATWSARARSPTSRCTTRDIVVREILGQPGPAGRLPGAAPGHVHRPGDRQRRTERGAGPRAPGSTSGSAHARRPSTRGWIHKRARGTSS